MVDTSAAHDKFYKRHKSSLTGCNNDASLEEMPSEVLIFVLNSAEKGESSILYFERVQVYKCFDENEQNTIICVI